MPTPQERDHSSNQTESQPPSQTGAGTSFPEVPPLTAAMMMAQVERAMREQADAISGRRIHVSQSHVSQQSISQILSETAPRPGSPNVTGRRSQRVRLGGVIVDIPLLTPSERSLLRDTPPSSSTPETPSTSSSTPSTSVMDPGSQDGSPFVESTRLPDGHIAMNWRWDEALGQTVGYAVPTREAGSSNSMHEHAVPSHTHVLRPALDDLLAEGEHEQRALEMRETLRELVNDYNQAPDGDL